jgi:acetolactate synthase-1/3 small subunit
VLLQTLAMQKVMSKFGIIEVARTGRICLKRGEELLEGRDLEGRVRRMRGS